MKTRESDKNMSKVPETTLVPVIFVGHGNPMNAIHNNDITMGWKKLAGKVDKPNAILCISAHWETNGAFVTSDKKPKTIHDFYGFPKELFDVEYPASGAPKYAKLTQELIQSTNVNATNQWGLDHGTWSVLVKMFPNADIPVFQFSLDKNLTPSEHFSLGQELLSLRKKGVLIIGSGNIVHNLNMLDWKEKKPYDWAIEFDNIVKSLIDSGDFKKLIQYEKLGTAAKLSIPTREHYLPVLYALALKQNNESVEYYNEVFELGSISMRSFIIS